jgi:hypothetical protein
MSLNLAILCLVVAGCSIIGAAATDSSEAIATEPPGYVGTTEAKSLLEACDVIGVVEVYFRIPPGDSYRTVLPKMATSPELEGVDGAFVAIYDGEVQALHLTGQPGVERPKLKDAICVVLPDGEPILYVNVSRENMAVPAGAHFGPPPT